MLCKIIAGIFMLGLISVVKIGEGICDGMNNMFDNLKDNVKKKLTKNND